MKFRIVLYVWIQPFILALMFWFHYFFYKMRIDDLNTQTLALYYLLITLIGFCNLYLLVFIYLRSLLSILNYKNSFICINESDITLPKGFTDEYSFNFSVPEQINFSEIEKFVLIDKRSGGIKIVSLIIHYKKNDKSFKARLSKSFFRETGSFELFLSFIKEKYSNKLEIV